MVRTRLRSALGVFVAGLIACSTALRIEQGADDAGAGGIDGGDGGASSESGTDKDGGTGDASTPPRCTLPPCAAMPTGAPALEELAGIVATNDAVVVAHGAGLTWCTNPACSTASTIALTGAGAIGIATAPPIPTVLAVSAGNRLFRCQQGVTSCMELFQNTGLANLTSFAAGPTRLFWINPTGSLFSMPWVGTPAAISWASPNVAGIELAALPDDTVLAAIPGQDSVIHVTGPSSSIGVASLRDVSGPRGVAVSSGAFYVASTGNGTIVRCPTSGCSNAADASVGGVVATSQNAPRYVTTDTTHVYWTNEGSGASDGTVARAPLSGGAPEVVITGLAKPRYIAVNGVAIWVTVGPVGAANDLVYVLK